MKVLVFLVGAVVFSLSVPARLRYSSFHTNSDLAMIESGWQYLRDFTTDRHAFVLAQAILVLLVLVGFLKTYMAKRRAKRGAPHGVLGRGDESLEFLHLSYAFLSVVALQSVSATPAPKDHKTLVSILDLLALGYLCYWNGWFRNKLVTWGVNWKRRPERVG